MNLDISNSPTRIPKAAPGSNTTNLYYTSNWQVVEERINSGSLTLSATYVWSPVYVDAMVERDYDFTNNGTFAINERVYVLQDANYNATGLVVYHGVTADGTLDGIVDIADQVLVANHWNQIGPGGDAIGDFNHDGVVDFGDDIVIANNWNRTGTPYWSVVQRYVYNPYGTFTTYDVNYNAKADWLGWTYTFQGLKYDARTGFFYDRGRDTSATLMRAVEGEPSGANPYVSGLNLYPMYGDNPINLVDPSGLLIQMPEDEEAPILHDIFRMSGGGTGGGGPYTGSNRMFGSAGGGGPQSLGPQPQFPSGGFGGGGSMSGTSGIGAGGAQSMDSTTLVPTVGIHGYASLVNEGLAAMQEIRLLQGKYQQAKAEDQDEDCKKCKFPINFDVTGKSWADRAGIIEYAILANEWLLKNGPHVIISTMSTLYPGTNRTYRQMAAQAARDEYDRNPTFYPRPLVVGHVPDVCVSGDPDPELHGGWWLPMTGGANSTVAGVEVHYTKKIVSCFTVNGKNPLSLTF